MLLYLTVLILPSVSDSWNTTVYLSFSICSVNESTIARQRYFIATTTYTDIIALCTLYWWCIHTILMTLYTPNYSVNKPFISVGCKHQKPGAICDKINTPILVHVQFPLLFLQCVYDAKPFMVASSPGYSQLFYSGQLRTGSRSIIVFIAWSHPLYSYLIDWRFLHQNPAHNMWQTFEFMDTSSK